MYVKTNTWVVKKVNKLQTCIDLNDKGSTLNFFGKTVQGPVLERVDINRNLS